MKIRSISASTTSDDEISRVSHETSLSGRAITEHDGAESSDSESSYETVVIRPARTEIVKVEEEIEVSDYVTDSEAEEEARIRRENRKNRKCRKPSSKTKVASPAPERRASAPSTTNKKPVKSTAAQEKPKRNSWFNFRNTKKNKDEEKEKQEEEPANEPEPAPNKPVERMKHKPKDYYHGFSRDHCDAAKDMKREWKHKSKDRMEARKKALEACSDSSESVHEKKLKRVVTKVTVMKEVEVEIPAETIRRKKEKSFRTIKVCNTRRIQKPKTSMNKEKCTANKKNNVETEHHVVDVETGKKCYMWYARLGQPNKTKFVQRVQEMLDEGEVIGFKVKDVEALPWVAGGMLLSVSKMNKLFLQPEDLSDEESSI